MLYGVMDESSFLLETEANIISNKATRWDGILRPLTLCGEGEDSNC